MIIGKNTNQYNICGRRIRLLREKKKMTQEQLAAKLQVEGLGMNQNSISRIETGKRIVTDFEIVTIAKVFGVTTDDLLLNED